ncbi:hypothetical protein CPB85DRAFT_1457509 [Mucidula mucida]|nr:hypothetical protein CPB85DRAFT_1457509 [Mucidula mucida]
MAFFKRLFFFLTIYTDVQRGLQDPQYIPQLMKKLGESRNMTLLIHLFWVTPVLHYEDQHEHDARLAHISKQVQRVILIGPIVFTIVFTIPNVLLWILIVHEIIRSTPNAGVGVVFALLACIPLIFHVVWFEIIAYMQEVTVTLDIIRFTNVELKSGFNTGPETTFSVLFTRPATLNHFFCNDRAAQPPTLLVFCLGHMSRYWPVLMVVYISSALPTFRLTNLKHHCQAPPSDRIVLRGIDSGGS